MCAPTRMRIRILLALCLAAVLTVATGCSGEPGGGAANNGDQSDAAADTEDDSDAGADADAPDTGGDAADTNADGSDDAEPSSLSLRVLNIDGAPVEGATATVAGASKSTDASGRVTFDELVAGRLVAQVEADGFAPSTEVLTLPEATDAVQTLHLLATGEPHPFDPTTPSELYEDRVRLSIPANALVDENGDAYAGAAQALITPLNPSTGELAAMPGPLEGILEGDSEPTPMQSVFMADIQLQTDTGAPLSIADGQQATLEFVIPDDLQSDFTVGDEIEAYWYDIDAGHWIQEGKGDVIESTYAAGRLSWQVDVSHFTWWNCDEPWYDKECVEVEVIDEGTGDPVSGAQVQVDGVSYNGVTAGTTDADGTTCVDFKLDSTAQVSAIGPSGRNMVGDAIEITGNGTAATCGGQGSGSCQQVQIELAPPACLSGTVVDPNGDPIEGADINGFYDGAFGNESVSATTDASGAYCLSVPRQAQVDVIASRIDANGDYTSAGTTVSAANASQTCGRDSCTDAGALTPEVGQTGCVSGRGMLAPPGSDNAGSVPAGTHVYLFEGKRGDAAGAGDFVIDCSTPPGEWGTLLAETTTDAAGEFCLPAPVTANELSVVMGKCVDAEMCFRTRAGVTVSQTASCGSGNCTPLVEPIYMNRVECGVGP